MRANDVTNETPQQIGWKDGFYQEKGKCPYAKGTAEYAEYAAGWTQGKEDGIADHYNRTGNFPGGSDNQMS